MQKVGFVKFLIFGICVIFITICGVLGQEKNAPQIKSQEVSESDGIPVLIKHLPDWENVRNSAIHTNNTNDLRKFLGERPVFDFVDFGGGTEAVSAEYAQGKLLIIEYNTPQASVEADTRFNQIIAGMGQNSHIFYRRIGNYNTFVFDASDEASANALLDQVKYEKKVHWLGTDPFLLKRAERAIVQGLSELFIATTLTIVGGLGLSLLIGFVVGIIFFYIREQKRSTMETFSDAGGMTRLNLDDLTSQISTDRLLKD
ncbi:MAG: hypothetical protein LC778_08700 [Acidobacteria bacterium]|nr:hypothetical protein [Acidobacteriota bacterium]